MKTPITVLDCLGNSWRVEEARPTAHGWPLYLGRPILADGTSPRQGKTVIPTPELREHLTATIEHPYALDLPLCVPAIARLRKELGLQWHPHRRQWWADREAELQAMSQEAFGAKYGLTQSGVSQELRKRGVLRRPRRWREEYRPILGAPLTTAEIARRLGVAYSTARHWRSWLQAGR